MSEHEHAHHEQPDEHGQAEAQDDGFTIWSVHRRGGPAANGGRAPLEKELAALEAEGIIARGIYDVSGMRADADIMVWLHGTAGTRPEALQAAMRRVRRSRELAGTTLVWSAMGVHRDAEFNKQHVPGFMRGIAPKRWVTVYPFNRSYDWYLLPAEDRSRMLAEHGRAGAAYRGVLANTVSAFALGDYEWILPLESDELVELVDMMRELRAVEARLHVRDEVPFFTGRRIAVDEIEEVLA
ncbi:chlorite dismutase family protein [Agrococcus sediminis]|uniref:Coproheme decarboxylase n=1 Tax=Agrococcus sediminis TaxID=2599924 RepID=A0A5M8QMH0_9MICO|nr:MULTISPECIES: hydrogen peroxide-dependent heme synthase [Agrococcus]KAA6436164.1 chlorite dismutase family protein [Agrococcus sediminis]MDR7233868.1 chlorite dismutase [Agrococcus sp. BE272]